VKTLYVFCEGLTEQGFCNRVLAPHLYTVGFLHVPTIRVAFSRHHGVVHRGGVGRYEPLRRDILHTLKSRRDRDVFFTSMLDLYRLPRDFPGRTENTRNPDDPRPYIEALEAAFGNDISDLRFVPHLQLHEYETLLYADPEAFRVSFDDCEKAIAALKEIVAAFPTIEHINDGDPTAPSKRIIELLPAYEGLKATAGPDIAELIGLPVLRAKCPHFDAWITRLENLS
jgi:hypothetical protein